MEFDRQLFFNRKRVFSRIPNECLAVNTFNRRYSAMLKISWTKRLSVHHYTVQNNFNRYLLFHDS